MRRRHGPFEVSATRRVYENPWITVREDRVVRPDGSPGLFGIVDLIPGATVLAQEPDGDVWLVREFKYALGRESLEAVSGALDPGETPEAAAARELEEELGVRASAWRSFGQIDPFTTVVASTNWMFLARGLSPVAAHPDAGEVIVPVRMSLREALDRVDRGEIVHAATVVLLLRAASLT